MGMQYVVVLLCKQVLSIMSELVSPVLTRADGVELLQFSLLTITFFLTFSRKNTFFLINITLAEFVILYYNYYKDTGV